MHPTETFFRLYIKSFKCSMLRAWPTASTSDVQASFSLQPSLQVKATIEPRADRRRKACYMFTRANGDAQIFAYVALDIRLFILRDAPIGKTVRIKPADFTRQAMDDSIKAMLG
jgi:hypothetical protein